MYRVWWGVFEQMLEQKARARGRKAPCAMKNCLDFSLKGMGNMEGILNITSSRRLIRSHLLLAISLWEQYREWVGGRTKRDKLGAPGRNPGGSVGMERRERIQTNVGSVGFAD